MPVLPVLRGRQIVHVFDAFGWRIACQRGSHISLVKPNYMATLSVPDREDVAKGTLRSLSRAPGPTAEAFIAEAEKL